jgi:hypothetical protein
VALRLCVFHSFSRRRHPLRTQLTTSAQTVAGIISLLNDYLISKGAPVLGFLNPWIYSEGLPSFTDITSGSNSGCGTEGFDAIVGWDPVRSSRLVPLFILDYG